MFHAVLQPGACILVFGRILRVVQPAIVHLEFRDCCASCSSFFVALAGMPRSRDTAFPFVRLVFHASHAGVHVSVVDGMLGCCAFALWNYCVASEAEATGYAFSCCWCEALSIHAARPCGRHHVNVMPAGSRHAAISPSCSVFLWCVCRVVLRIVNDDHAILFNRSLAMN